MVDREASLLLVVNSRGRTTRVTGRAALMICYVLAYAERINALTRDGSGGTGSLTLHYSGSKVKPEWQEQWGQLDLNVEMWG